MDLASPEATVERRGSVRSPLRRPRIGLVVGHPRRDLLGLILVALELVRAGAEALLIPHHTTRPDGTFGKVDAILLNHARATTMPVVRWFAGLGKAVFVLDDEGYLSSNRHAMLLRAIADLRIASYLSGYFVWGEESGKALAKADPALAGKITATGCPRFDLLAPRWSGTLQFESKGYVLLNPNFNGINPHDAKPLEVREEMIRNGWEPTYLDRFRADMQVAFKGFLELCATLPRRLPNRQFILRPHPFEAVEPYARAVAGLDNVKLDTKGDVSRVLANASHLVHVNCNTAVEARLLGLRPIQLAYLATPFLRDHLPVYSGVSVQARDLDDLCRLLTDEVAMRERDDARAVFERWIRPSFHECDGYSARRIAEAMLAIVRQGTVSTPAPAVPRFDVSVRGAKLAISGLLGTEALQSLRRWAHPHRCAKAFQVGEVRDLIHRLCAHLKMTPPTVRQLSSPWTALPMSAIKVG